MPDLYFSSDKAKAILKKAVYDTNNTNYEKLKVGDEVCLIGQVDTIFFAMNVAKVKVTRRERYGIVQDHTIGLEFVENIGGHNLDGAVEQGHGWWCNPTSKSLIICNRNMDEFYSNLQLR